MSSDFTDLLQIGNGGREQSLPPCVYYAQINSSLTISVAVSRTEFIRCTQADKSNMRIYKSKKEIPRKAFLLISVSLCLANARAFELLSLRTLSIADFFFEILCYQFILENMAATCARVALSCGIR